MGSCAPLASAQPPRQRWEVFAEGGGSFWNNHYLDSSVLFGTPLQTETLRRTTHVGASGRLFVGFRLWINTREALEASYSYATTDVSESRHCEEVNCGVGWSTSAARLHLFSVNYVRELRARGRLRPFLTAGVGLVYFQRIVGPIYDSDPFAVNLGGGVDVRLTRHWLLRGEYRDWLFEGPRQTDFNEGVTNLVEGW